MSAFCLTLACFSYRLRDDNAVPAYLIILLAYYIFVKLQKISNNEKIVSDYSEYKRSQESIDEKNVNLKLLKKFLINHTFFFRILL